MAVWFLTIVVIGSALFVGNAIASGEWGLLLVLVFWSLPLGYYGSRLMRLSAVADADGVIVHNRYRSRTLRWSDIEAISYEKRRGPWWYPLVMIWDRWVGCIRLRDGSDVEVDATETFWANWSAHLFTGSKRSGDERTARLVDAMVRFQAPELRNDRCSPRVGIPGRKGRCPGDGAGS